MVDVTFDRPLVAGALDFTNWRVVKTQDVYVPTAAVAVGALVTLTMAGAVPDAGPDRVTYLPPPFDVRTAAGGHAPAFADYPMA